MLNNRPKELTWFGSKLRGCWSWSVWHDGIQSHKNQKKWLGTGFQPGTQQSKGTVKVCGGWKREHRDPWIRQFWYGKQLMKKWFLEWNVMLEVTYLFIALKPHGRRASQYTSDTKKKSYIHVVATCVPTHLLSLWSWTCQPSWSLSRTFSLTWHFMHSPDF